MPKQQNTTQKAALPLRGSRFFYRAAGSAYKNRLPTALTSIQAAIPQRVGSTAASAVHLRLPVSFLMVISVVAQGQCISEKSMVQRAVTEVQPLARNSSRMAARLVGSCSVPCDR